MPTTDQLQSQLNALSGTVSAQGSRISSNETSIHNLNQEMAAAKQRIKTNEDNIAQHRIELDQHRKELDDHERRLKLIELDNFQYTVPHYVHNVKLPSLNEQNNSITLFMPAFTKDELKEYNESMPGLVDYKWYQKIFNPSFEQGAVTFDFDNSRDYLKSISLGPHSHINIPIPLLVDALRPNRRLIIQSCYLGLLCSQQFMEFEKENVVTLFNFTNSTINIETNKPILELVSVYGYTQTEPTQNF